MSKQIKRKITVNLTPKNKTLPKPRPSVFERLGTKANSTNKEYCHHWAQSGSCPYGKGCKYSSTHTLISPSKQRAAKTQTATKRRHVKDAHKRLHAGEPEDWDQWDPDELEDADPDDLEKRRQELQRELELQMKMENKARKKDKKVKKESSPSSDSSSSSSETTTSSDESSSTSSSSVESRRKKVKKTKSKRASSSSSEERVRKHKSKTKKLSKSIVRDKSKKSLKPPNKVNVKAPSPVRVRKKSETPPLKSKQLAPSKKANSETKSPRPVSCSSDRKEKHRTPSPKTSKEKEREKDREKEKEREREKEREKEKEREREREKEKEREREKEKERERERAKERAKEREKEKEKDYKKKEPTRSPKRDNKTMRDTKKRDTPDSSHSRDRKASPSRSKGGGSSSSRRDHKSPPSKDDRRSVKRDDRARSRGKDRPNDKNRKDKRDSRDRDRERERERERRIAREEREAAREKEREEALARCQERQRERERLKELAKKEEERRGRDRNRRDDRGLEKPSGDRVDRLLPLPEDRLSSLRKAHSTERDRNDRRDRDRHDRTPDSRSTSRKSPDRHERLDRDLDKDRNYDRNYDRSTDRNYDRDRDHDRDRDYSGLPPRIRESERRLDDKDYDSPYDRNRHEDRRFLEIDDHYNENSRDDRIPLDGRDYPDDRRTRRDLWDMREDRGELDRERELDHRGRYGREESRPPTGIKGREWDPEYSEHEWDRSRRPLDWENRENWDSLDHKHSTEEEWRHYNRSVDSWSNEERRRWPGDWRERSRPRSSTSHHNIDIVNDDSNTESRRKDPSTSLNRLEQTDPKIPPSEVETKKDIVAAPKRPAEESLENAPEVKKVCLKPEAPPVLEDDLSEISDDADEILNRDEEIFESLVEEQSTQPDTTDSTSVKDQNTSTASQKSQSPPRSPNKILQKEESIEEDNMDLDFEEISEDELEEESKIKGIGDALGVDWASLVAEFQPRSKPTSSAKLRWESHNVLVHLGVSVRFAGEDLVKDILKEHAEAKVKENLEENKKMVKATIKTEPLEVNVNGIKQEIKEEPVDIKQEAVDIKEEIQTELEDVVISHPIAAIQVANHGKQSERKTLFTSVGPHRRALAARRDLTIRRHLCNLPVNDMYVEAPKRHDPELLKIATQLFERCL